MGTLLIIAGSLLTALGTTMAIKAEVAKENSDDNEEEDK